jgi:hypothetical protein
MSFLMPKMKTITPNAPIPPVPPPAAIDAPVTAVEDSVKADLRRRRGRASTIATGVGGLMADSPINKVSLLGGM